MYSVKTSSLNMATNADHIFHFRFTPFKVAEERTQEKDDNFAQCARTHLDGDNSATTVDAEINILSSLIASAARPTAATLKELSRHHEADKMFREFCFLAVTSAGNPFIPGITLSTVLAEAAKQANEGERKNLTDIRAGIDELLLEMFERLPQTVRGFEGGLDVCTYVFEPEPMRGIEGLRGPLDMVISDPQQLKTFCKVPLVMDFLSSKFMLGLPDLNDTKGVLRNDDQLDYLRRLHTDGNPNGLVLGDVVGALLQAAEAEDSSMTFFPGAQFIVAGVVALPANYYKVPAMQMALDFVVYIATVAALSYFVFFHTAAGSMLDDNDLIVDHNFSFSEGACALVFVAVRSLLFSVFLFFVVSGLLTKPGRHDACAL